MLNHHGQVHIMTAGGRPAPYDWAALEADATVDIKASDLTPGVVNDFTSPFNSRAHTGGTCTASLTSFNGVPGALQAAPYTNSYTPQDTFGGALPRNWCIAGVIRPTAADALVKASPWGADGVWYSTNFRQGVVVGLEGGIYQLGAYVYNGTVFVMSFADIGPTLPANGFFFTVQHIVGGNLVALVNGGGNTQQDAVGAGMANDTLGGGFMNSQSGGAMQGYWARLAIKGNSAYPAAAAANWPLAYL